MTDNYYKESHLITLHSSDALNQYNGTYLSNVDFKFNNLLKPSNDILFSEILLLKAEIPVSFYAINATNNVLSYYTTTTKSITIPVGNYNANLFITQLQTSFSANGDSFTITISSSTGILTFTCTSSFTFYFTNSTCLSILGFNKTSNYSSSSNTLNGIYPLNLLGIKRISVKSNQLIANNYSSTNQGLDSVLGVIQVNQPSFNLIIYQAQQQEGHYLRNRSINLIDIQLIDEYGNYINFNGIDWTLTLLLTTTRKMINPIAGDLVNS